MKPSVVSKEYLALQTDISNKQTEWANKLNKSDVVKRQALINKQVPIISQVNMIIDYSLYKEWMIELADFLAEKEESLQEDVHKLKEILTDEIVKRWADEVLAFNQLYFDSLAEKEELPVWLPYFLAEHSLRPYLRVVSEVFAEDLPTIDAKGSCPCCGEPLRIAVLEGKGKKMICCPRCEAKWNQKRLHCSFCGNEDHDKIKFYNVENDASQKLEVCSQCNGYLKLIDTRKLFKKQTAFLLDVNSLHLDFVAQENGFGIMTDEEVKS